MTADQRKTKSELMAELAKIRRLADRAKKLNQNLKNLRSDYRALEARCDEQARTLRQECTLRDQTEEALRLAEVIIAQSPACASRGKRIFLPGRRRCRRSPRTRDSRFQGHRPISLQPRRPEWF